MKKIELQQKIDELDECLERAYRNNDHLAYKLFSTRLALVDVSGLAGATAKNLESTKAKLTEEQAEVIRLRGLLSAEIELRQELSEELLRRSSLDDLGNDIPVHYFDIFSTRLP